jgi:hypothetical protein
MAMIGLLFLLAGFAMWALDEPAAHEAFYGGVVR